MKTEFQKPDPVVEEAQDFKPPEQYSDPSAAKFSIEAWAQDRTAPQKPGNVVGSVLNDKVTSFLPELILTPEKTTEQIQSARQYQFIKPQEKDVVLKQKDAQNRPIQLEQNGIPIRFEYEGNSKLPKTMFVGEGENVRKFNLDLRALATNQLAYTFVSGGDKDTTIGGRVFANHIKPLLEKANLKIIENNGDPPRIIAIHRANGEQLFFKYALVRDALGRNDNISEITTILKSGIEDTWKLQPDALTWRKVGEEPNNRADTWKGFKRLDQKTGVLVEVGESTRPAKENPDTKPEPVVVTRTFKLDGTPDQPVVDDGKTEKDRPLVREVRLEVRLKAINGALEGRFTLDQVKLVRNQFKDLSAEEIHLMRLKQPNLYETLEAKFKGQFGPNSFQWREVQGHLRRSGQPGEREAIQLIIDATESQLNFGKDRNFSEILGTSRRILAGLTDQRRQEINQALVRLYPDAGIKNGLQDLFSETGHGKYIYKHDNLHRKLIDYAIKPKQAGEQSINAQVEILQAAFKTAKDDMRVLAQYARDLFGGTLISKDARQKFLEQSTELPKPKSSEDSLLIDEVRDYLKTGNISAKTEFLKAVSGFSSNEENAIDNAFMKWTPEMRSQYLQGRFLARQIAAGRLKGPDADSKDANALDFFKDWQSVFQKAHWAPGKAERMLHKYEARILYPENNILNEITDVGSQWLNWREEHNRGLKLNERDFGWFITGITNQDSTLSSPFSQALLAAMHDNFSHDPTIINPIKTITQARLAFVQDFNRTIGTNKPENEKLAYLHEKVPGFKQLTLDQQKQALTILTQGLTIQENLNRAVTENKQAPVEAEDRLNPNEKQLLSQYRKFLLEATQQTQSRNLAQAIFDNHHTVWKNDSLAILDGIKSMNAQELKAFRNDGPLEIEVNGQKIKVDNYRQYIDGRLDAVLGKDTTAREAARVYLDQLKPGDKSDKTVEDTVAFSLLKASLQAGNYKDKRALVISNLAEALAKDKDLGVKLQSDPSFEHAIKHILGWDKNAPNYKKYIEPMLTNGILPADILKEIFTERIEHQRQGHGPGQTITEVQHVFNQRSFIQNLVLNLNPKAIRHLNSNPAAQDAFLKLLDPKGQELAQTLLKQVEVLPEDRARAFILGLAQSKEEIQKLFSDLNPANRLRSMQDYESKYGERLSDNIVNILGSRQQKTFDYLFRSNEWTSDEAYLNTLNRIADSAYSFNASFGTKYNTELLQILTNFEKLRHEHNDDIPKELLQKELLKADKAIQDFIKTKHETIEKTVDALVTVAAIGASFFTGGASLAALARLAYWARVGKASLAGGLLGSALKAGLEGKDFEAREILGDFLRYTTLTGTNLLGAEAILAPLASKFGSRLLGRIFAGSQREITIDGSKLILSEASAQQFRQGLRKIVSDSLEGRITNLDKSIDLLIKGLRTESGEVIDSTLAQGLNKLVKSNFDRITKVTAQHFIAGLLTRSLFESQVSGLGGLASELIDSLVENGKIDPDKLQQAIGLGLFLGLGGRLGLETVLKGGTRAAQRVGDWRHSLTIGPETRIAEALEGLDLSPTNANRINGILLHSASKEALIERGFKLMKEKGDELSFLHLESATRITLLNNRIVEIADSENNVIKIKYERNRPYFIGFSNGNSLVNRYANPYIYKPKLPGWPSTRSDNVIVPVPPNHVRLFKSLERPEEQSAFLKNKLISGNDEFRAAAIYHKPWDSLSPEDIIIKAQDRMNIFTLNPASPERSRLLYVDVPKDEFLKWRNELLSQNQTLEEFRIPANYLKRTREHALSYENPHNQENWWTATIHKYGTNKAEKTSEFFHIPSLLINSEGKLVIHGVDNSIFQPEKILQLDKLKVIRVGASPEYAALIKNAIGNVPSWLREFLIETGVTIKVVSHPDQHLSPSALRGKPRGWTKNADFSNSLAFYDSMKNEILLFESNLPKGQLAQVFTHEIGHAIENFVKYQSVIASNTAAAQRAYAADLLTLFKQKPFLRNINPSLANDLEAGEYDYFLTDKNKKLFVRKGTQESYSHARSEVFAEITSKILLKQIMPDSPNDIELLFPNSSNFIKQVLKELMDRKPNVDSKIFNKKISLQEATR
ncbi:MAG: hypothetical protein IPG59_03180 [Candidatus Melainabacteria bacterium]|nr:MAG: hypothetical protein IPG59_03180 [Candidatus Melainabacteria bacterium]